MTHSTLRISLILLLQFLTLLATPATAANHTTEPAQAPAKEGKVEAFHSEWSNKVLRPANKLDGIFGYKPGIESLEFGPERALNNRATR